MRIAVVGTGHVGLVTAACFAELGHEVILVDNDAKKLAALRKGSVPIHERFLPELLQRHGGLRLVYSEDLCEAAQASSVIFITVDTPLTKEGDADLSYVESVAQGIAQAIDGDYKLVVGKKAVPVYTNTWIRKVMLLNGALEASFDVAVNPEFLREGSAVTDFLYPERIVLGADNERSVSVLRRVYQPLIDGSYYKSITAIPAQDSALIPPRVIVASASSAELIKHAADAFLALKISFANAVANVCESVGADVNQVCQGMGSDSRIGMHFLQPGIGYGGACFSEDLTAFRAMARECGYDFRLLDEIVRINEDQRQRFMRKVRSALWTLKGKRLAVLGLSFKGGTDDIRESPALALVELLLKEGSQVIAYDPAATENARKVLGDRVIFAGSAYETASGADALLVLTDWDEFRSLDLTRLYKLLRFPVVIDGRNLYDPVLMTELGFLYYSVGRPPTSPRKPDAVVEGAEAGLAA
jgi:UDPglucose 6-dehydrogenase